MSEKTWKWEKCKNPDGGNAHEAWKFETCKPVPSEGNDLPKMIVRIGRFDASDKSNIKQDFKYRTINRGDTISCSPQGFAGNANPIKYNYCHFLDYS